MRALAQRYTGASRFADLIELYEAELAGLEAHASAETPRVVERRADRHLEVGTLWERHFARLDRALAHFQQAFQLAPQKIEALEHARRLYRSLGEDAMVARLYELELDVLAPEDASEDGHSPRTPDPRDTPGGSRC